MSREKDRIKRAQEIATAVKEGNYMPPAVSMQDSWFPKRNKIKKNKNALEMIHGANKKPKLSLIEQEDE